MKNKTCTKCKETKPVSEFYKNQKLKDGLTYECMVCTKERQRRYREANKEKQTERLRKYYEENKRQFYRRNEKVLKDNNNRSLEFAHNKSKRWEDWEDDFVLADNGLTNYQKAVKLGRSLYSLVGRKSYLRKNLVTS